MESILLLWGRQNIEIYKLLISMCIQAMEQKCSTCIKLYEVKYLIW